MVCGVWSVQLGEPALEYVQLTYVKQRRGGSGRSGYTGVGGCCCLGLVLDEAGVVVALAEPHGEAAQCGLLVSQSVALPPPRALVWCGSR
eukprot:COSAG01_NODE_5731_length_4070_cov_3.367666_3_plen_90_part_00